VNRTDELDVQHEQHAGPELEAAPRDLTVIRQRGARSGEPPAAGLTRVAPAEQLVVGDIPALRAGFQPRPSLLAQLTRASQGASPVVQVLTGGPGTGKTQLAAAYVRARLTAGWRLAAWVNAESLGSVLAGLSAVADVAGLSDGSPGRGAADAGQKVRQWLEADGNGCLLVFDDVRDPDLLRPFLPVGGTARVLITAAEESVADLGANVPVDAFTVSEALALLDGRTGLDDEAGASAVAAALGCLPLAVDQAATVIAKQHLGYGAYLGRLRALSAEEYMIPEEGQPYPRGAAEAVLMSLEDVRAADQANVCMGALELAAVLPAAGVSRDLLRFAAQTGALIPGGQQVAAAQVDRALALLIGRSLMGFSLDGQSVIMHRLVARVVRDGLARQKRLTPVCQAAAAVLQARAEAPARLRNRIAIRDLPQQVTALRDSASRAAGEPGEDLTRVLLRLRFLAMRQLIELEDSMAQAIAVGESLAADLEQMLGSDHPDTLNVVNSLAAAYHAAGRAAEAVPLFEQVLIGRVRRLGHDHPDTLVSEDNLAVTYQDAGRAVEAVFLLRLTLAARERLLGVGHPSTLNSRGDLAVAYRDLGRTAEAIPLFEQVLAGRERLLGSDHPDTLGSQDNLAAAYLTVGRPAEAVILFEETVAVCERLLGAEHPRTQAARNHLALASQEQADQPG
jgi:tetratricopeptide (TPR) repeat protein